MSHNQCATAIAVAGMLAVATDGCLFTPLGWKVMKEISLELVARGVEVKLV